MVCGDYTGCPELYGHYKCDGTVEPPHGWLFLFNGVREENRTPVSAFGGLGLDPLDDAHEYGDRGRNPTCVCSFRKRVPVDDQIRTGVSLAENEGS